jgi:hypothetical protein
VANLDRSLAFYSAVGTGLRHFVIKVESMDATIAELSAPGIEVDLPASPDDSDQLSNDVDCRARRKPDRVGAVAGRSR